MFQVFIMLKRWSYAKPMGVMKGPMNCSEIGFTPIPSFLSKLLHQKLCAYIKRKLCNNHSCYVRQWWLISALLLELSRSILSYISLIISSALQYTMLIFRFPYLCTLRQNRRNDATLKYKIFTFITTIFFYHYNTINIIHKCTLNCKSFLVSSSSSSL